jgi:colicin import membrane protein
MSNGELRNLVYAMRDDQRDLIIGVRELMGVSDRHAAEAREAAAEARQAATEARQAAAEARQAASEAREAAAVAEVLRRQEEDRRREVEELLARTRCCGCSIC